MYTCHSCNSHIEEYMMVDIDTNNYCICNNCYDVIIKNNRCNLCHCVKNEMIEGRDGFIYCMNTNEYEYSCYDIYENKQHFKLECSLYDFYNECNEEIMFRLTFIRKHYDYEMTIHDVIEDYENEKLSIDHYINALRKCIYIRVL